jgi:hypothetical protein
LEQLATVSLWQDKTGVQDITEHLRPMSTLDLNDLSPAYVAPALRNVFTSGSAPVHDRSRLPIEFATTSNGHEGSHHFLANDFVTAVNTGSLPPVNAWATARYTPPGIVAHESALNGGVRLSIPGFGASPS